MLAPRIRWPLLIVTLRLLLGGGTNYVGDEPNECSDGADNDRDGLFDCDDPGCAASPDCDGVADDDDAVDDDDDDGSETELVTSEAAIVAITAPNYGFDLGTELAVVTIEGVGREDVVSISWSTDTGESGSADGLQTWSAADVPLVPGDNTITVTGTTDGGDTGSDTIVVTSSPGVPLASGLVLSASGALAGSPLTVNASLWIADETDLVSVELGPSTGDDLDATWSTLTASDDEGFYTGSFVVDEASPTTFELRALITYADAAGTTPPVHFEVLEAPDTDELSDLALLASEIQEVLEDNDSALDPLGARDAAIEALLTEGAVTQAGTSDNDGYGLWWITEPGIGFVVMNNASGDKGGGSHARKAMPRTHFPSQGKGSIRGWTASSAGTAGRVPAIEERNSNGVTGNVDGIALGPFFDDFGADDDAPDVNESMSTVQCPLIPVAGYMNGSADVGAFENQFGRGLVHISSHGDSYFAASGMPLQWGWSDPGGLVAILTREEVALGTLADHALDLMTGRLVIAVIPNSGLFLAITPSWVTSNAAANPFPASVVGLSTCRSAWNGSLAQAYLSAGAAYVFGFTDYVDASFAEDRSNQFWDSFLARDSAVLADSYFVNPQTPDDSGDPAYAVSYGNTDLYLGAGQLLNGDFEMGAAGWTTWGDGYFDVAGSVWGMDSSQPPEGMGMAYGEIWAPNSNYMQWSTPFCPVPEKPVTVSFQWQVLSEEWGNSCDSTPPNWLNMRIDKPEWDGDNEVVWSIGWQDICGTLTLEGDAMATGWQQAIVTFTAPQITNPAVEFLAFSIGGWNPQAWWGLIDEIQISQ